MLYHTYTGKLLKGAKLLAVVLNILKLHKDQLQYLPDEYNYDLSALKLVKARKKKYIKGIKTKGTKVYTALDLNGIHGTAMAWANWNDYKNGRGISSFYVDPEYRGQGIGTNLLNNILQDAKKDKMKKLFLMYFLDNPAKNLYDRKGFKPFITEAVKEL